MEHTGTNNVKLNYSLEQLIKCWSVEPQETVVAVWHTQY
jgi:hypothetical protein